MFFGGELFGDRAAVVARTDRDAFAVLGRGEHPLRYIGVRAASKQCAGLAAARGRGLVITKALKDFGPDDQCLGEFENSSALAGQADSQVSCVCGGSRVATHIEDGGRR